MQNIAFFSENGLTSTSANHIANLAKEYAKDNESGLNSVSFIDTEVSIIGSDTTHITHKGWGDIFLSGTGDLLRSVAESYSLIAWLREAIKAKEALSKKIRHYDLSDYCKEFGVEMPVEPRRKTPITREEYIDTLSVKERNRMLTLEAKAAVFGKYIHPDGAFAKARKELMDKQEHSVVIDGKGRDTLLYKHTPTVEVGEVDYEFYALQNEYRETQAELNGILHKIELAVQQDADEKAREYSEKLAEYNAVFSKLQKEMLAVQQERLEKARNLKIAIPNDLRSIYETVSKLGKN